MAKKFKWEETGEGFFKKMPSDEEFYDNVGSRERIEATIRLTPEYKKMLDIGCAYGYISKKINEKHKGKIYGVDVESKLLEYAKKNGLITKKVNIEKEKLPFKDGEFDVVLCLEIIEHIANPYYLLAESLRVLKKGGYIIISTPNLSSWSKRIKLLVGKAPVDPILTRKPWVGCHIREFTYKEIRDGLSYFGCKVDGFIGLSRPSGSLRTFDYLFKRFPTLAPSIVIKAKKVRKYKK